MPNDPLKQKREAAFERGQHIGRAILVIVPFVLLVAAPRFWSNDYPLAGLALVFGHLVGFFWLPDAIGTILERRVR